MTSSATNRRRLAWLSAIAFGIATLPFAARAQEHSAGDVAQARELLNQGLALRNKGDAENALEKFRGAHALIHTPITGIELGRTYALLGKLVEARETFLSIARIQVAPEETARSTVARTEGAKLAEQIRPRIPSLTVRVTGVPIETVAITIDGAAVPPEALAASRLVDPGSHRLTARSTAGGSAETVVDAKEGEARDVELKIAFAGGAPPSPTPGPPPSVQLPSATSASDDKPTQSPSTAQRAVGWSLLVGGAVVSAAAAVLMVVEANKAKDANQNRDHNAYDSASTTWTIGLIGGLVGVAAVAGGGIVLATSPGGSNASRSEGRIWFGLAGSNLRVGGAW